MRARDIFVLAMSALWQQKVRTLLTTLGVVFGSFVLAASLSIAQGVQETIERESHRSDFLRKIDVGSRWGHADPDVKTEKVDVQGDMTEAKRQRIRDALLQHQLRFGARKPKVAITQEIIGK